MLFLLACTNTQKVEPFIPRRHMAGRIRTPFGSLKGRGIQDLCGAPNVRIGTVVDVAEPVYRPETGTAYRLTLDTEYTLQGPRQDSFWVETRFANDLIPTPGPGRYLLATATNRFGPDHTERVSIWATIDVLPEATLPPEAKLRSDFENLCTHARRWPR